MYIPNLYKNENLLETKSFFEENGFGVVEDIYNTNEITAIGKLINELDTSNPIFRKSEDLFAIRQFLKEVPEIKNLIFNQNLIDLINLIGGNDYFVVKSIYFDKPEKSNWFVSYHQDLTISVDKKIEQTDYSNWTKKHNQFAVQPPLNFLENIFTIRIHLDDTDENNGALKVIEKSHLKAVYRPETIDWNTEKETICNVKSGGVMLMKPLLLHSSGKTTNQNRRRVIHIEFSNQLLPENLNWAEFTTI